MNAQATAVIDDAEQEAQDEEMKEEAEEDEARLRNPCVCEREK